jgi:peptide methionine sulfoxide reductase MsrB
MFYYMEAGKADFVSLSEEEWKKRLTEEQYYVTQQKGTERVFTWYVTIHQVPIVHV